MMNNGIYFSGTFGEALRNPQSKTARTFFSGARAMLTALGLMTPGEYQQALSVKNQQHIIALLAKSEEMQQERRRSDMEALLKVYWANKEKMRGFIFDVPAIDALNGVATDSYGNHIENEEFELLPEFRDSYWPNYKITNVMDDSTITREEYLALDEDEQFNYSYTRYFMLETVDRKPALQISSIDCCAMEVLIRHDILIGDITVNRRYEYAITCDDPRFHELREYSDIIKAAFNELEHGTRPIFCSFREGLEKIVIE